MEHPESLRKLAEWYRAMANVGHTDGCDWRRRFADYLERRATELEHAERTCSEGKGQAEV